MSISSAERSTDVLTAPAGHAFRFATAASTLVTRGTRAIVPATADPEALCDAAESTLREADRGRRVAGESSEPPVLVGAVPFDLDGRHPAHLVLPEDVTVLKGRHLPDVGPEASAAARVAGHDPTAAVHRERVARVVRELAAGRLDKAVLARRLRLEAEEPIDPLLVLRRLMLRDPEAYAVAATLPDGAILVGASPELLVERRGAEVAAYPLAGSLPRSADPAEDRSRAAALRDSAKDLREHAYVVDDIVELLRPWCDGITAPARPDLARTARMWHLATPVRARLRDPDTSALRLALSVHPTPAICGTPTGEARRVIGEVEGFDRGYYAGTAGWTDAHGDGQWIVSIRCAQLDPDRRGAWAYAGGGLVAASDPQAESAEVDAKFRTVLDAFGVDPSS